MERDKDRKGVLNGMGTAGRNEGPESEGVHHAVGDRNTFSRIRWAVILFSIPFSLYILLSLVQTIEVPPFLTHILLTLTVVTAVHLLDRWVLFKDTAESLNNLREEIKTNIAQQIETLVHSSEVITSNSLAEIRTGVQSGIAQQTESLIKSSASLEAMARSGIVRIYSTRSQASEDIRRDLLDPDNSKIRIIGISLNDFIRGDHKALQEVWKKLEKYVRYGRSNKSPLDIKALIIDPGCLGAQLRSSAEVRGNEAVPGRLSDDVNAIVQALGKLEAYAREMQDKTGVSFECHLYRLPPILFLCLADSVCYIEQYHFWSERIHNTPIPVLKYLNHSEHHGVYPMHGEMESHFDWIWQKASIPVSQYSEQAVVGIDKGLTQRGVVNVFATYGEAYKRIRWMLDNAREKVSIMGISLHSFFSHGELFKAISRLVENDRLDIEVLVLDPGSNQAMIRSYRERLFVRPEQTLEEYKHSNQHQDSDLYRDTRSSIENINNLLADLKRIKNDPEWRPRLVVKQYESAPSCFILRVDDTVLVEQYHFGKLVPEEDKGHVPSILGKDMPILEYSSSVSSLYDNIPLWNSFRLFEDHFAFVFKQGKELDPDA